MTKFPLCLNTATIQPASLLDKIRVARQAGFEAIELWLSDVRQFCASGRKVSEVVAALGDAGLTVPSVIALKGWSGTKERERDAALDEIRRSFALAAELHAPTAVATPTPTREPVAETARRYGELLAIGESFGVRPAFEYIGFFEQYNNIPLALEVMRGCGRDDAVMVVDAFHCFRGEGTVEDLSRVSGNQISVVHIDDAPADPPRETQQDRDRVMPGDGVIDLSVFLTRLRTQGYTSWLSLELFNESYWSRDPLEVARISLEKTREVVAAAGGVQE